MTEDSIEIMKELREARLGWIADELAESIALGKQTTKEFREAGAKKATRASTIESFTPDEEMSLIVETLAQYFVLIPAAWKSAGTHFAQKETFAKVEIKEQPGIYAQLPIVGESFSAKLGIFQEGEGPFHDFDVAYLNESLPALRRVLSALWPDGAEDFEKHYPEPESITQ